MDEEMVTGILVKTDKETPLQGKVVNTVDTPYPEENAYSVDMIKKMLNASATKAFNADFQINQRGQNEYIDGGDTVDMWKTSKSLNKLTVNDGYVTFENKSTAAATALVQINNSFEVTKQYTVAVKFKGDDNVYSLTTDAGINKSIDILPGVKLQFYYNSTRVSLYLEPLRKVDIEYFDYTEGDVIFHVKEDYSIALMRCQRHCFAPRPNDTLVMPIMSSGDRTLLTAKIDLPKQMVGNPTIVIDDTKFTDAIFFPQTGLSYSISSIGIINGSRGLVYLKVTKNIEPTICGIGIMNNNFISIVTDEPV